ncbi:hypothetical protein L218DRAFT_984237 [Marasmius fiardii PR-910]|nr:hypothetical protein L218DRAFT_984237 [Marasmius fiardii PR-910]
MSTDAVPSFSYHSTTAGPQSTANFASKTSNSSYQQPSTPSQPGPSTWQTSGNNPAPQKTQERKARTSEENEIKNATSARFLSRLAEDHAAVLNPDVDSPFIDSVDVVKRLLPYHIYLNPREDLRSLVYDRKGKSKVDELRKENEETKYALDCFKRRTNLEKRFRNARIKAGQTPFKEETVVLDQVVLESERSEMARLSSELRAARAELERLERAKRAASNPSTSSTSTPRSSYYTPAMPANTPTGPTAYYRAYPYAYAQAYGTALATAPSISTFAVAPTTVTPVSASTHAQAPQTTSVPAQAQASSSAPTTPSVSASVPVSATAPVPTSTPSVPPSAVASTGISTTPSAVPYQAGVAIPVQLPMSSLPALHQLGIIPAPVSGAPTTGQTAPAVLRGSSGNMLNLEINVSQLQPAQMSGLALILNSLMSRTAASSGAQVYPSATPLPSAATSATATSNVTTNGNSM